MAREIEPHDVGGGDGGAIAQVDFACREGTERSSQHASVGEMGGRCIELVLRLDVVDRAEEKKNSRKQPESRVALAAALVRQCRCRSISNEALAGQSPRQCHPSSEAGSRPPA